MAVGFAAVFPFTAGSGERRIARPFQVGRVVVVQGEAFPEVLGQFALGVEGGQARGAGLLPGAGVPVVVDVEQVHGLAGQEEAVLASFGHAPHYRGHPAAAAQAAQHVPHPLLGASRGGGQVGRAGQGHPPGDFQQSPLFVVQWLPGRHCHSSSTWILPAAPEPAAALRPVGNPLALLNGQPGGFSRHHRRIGKGLFECRMLDIRLNRDIRLLISLRNSRKQSLTAGCWYRRPW